MTVSTLFARLLRTWRQFRGQGVSVICVYNDAQKLSKFLQASLEKQTYPFELIAIDNRQGQYTAAGTTLNAAARQARFPYLVFAHQDVAFISMHWLRKAIRIIRKFDKPGLYGVAGNGSTGMVASVFHGSPPAPAGPSPATMVEVQTLDGCLVILSKAIHDKLPFDESLKGWYLHVENYCLDLARYGYKSYVLPFAIYHESTGPATPKAYESEHNYLLRKHRSFVKVVYATVGEWRTDDLGD